MRERCLQLSDGKTDEVLQSDAALVGRQLGTGGREEGLVTGGGAPDHHHLAGLRLELKDELQGPGQVALDEGDRHRRLRVRRRRELLPARPGHDGNGWKQLLAVLAEEGGGLVRDGNDDVEVLAGVFPPDEVAQGKPLFLRVAEGVDVFGVDVEVGAEFLREARPDDPIDVGIGVEVGTAAPEHEHGLRRVLRRGCGRRERQGEERRAEGQEACGVPDAGSRQNSSRAANWNARGPPVPKAWPARALGWPYPAWLSVPP